MKNLRLVGVCFFLSAAVAPPQGLGMTPEEIRAEIKAKAADRHPNPPSDFWERMGPEAASVLKKMFREPLSSVERTWVIEGLGHVSDPEAAKLLEEEIKRPDSSGAVTAVFRKKMLSALIRSEGDRAFEFVEPYLQDPDPHIRLAVAAGMKASMSGDRAKKRLEEYQKIETTEWVKVAWTKVAPAPEVSPTPVSDEKSGDWEGLLIEGEKSARARGKVSSQGKEWKIEITLPKKGRLELETPEAVVQAFRTHAYQWIEVRVTKSDRVFLGRRKIKP